MPTVNDPMRLLGSGAKLAALSAAALLGGCVLQDPYYTPAAQQYAAPAYSEPQYGQDEPQIEVRATMPPPPLPVYEQPPVPGPGYLWTPGYWAYGSEGYFWVPGTWVLPPQIGFLWTPGYWAWSGGIFLFSAGYWGPHVGFYGGIRYGGGYDGEGYDGGRWVGGEFAYNRAVTNVNVTVIHNTYNETVINNNITVNRVSYNGGPHGIRAVMTPRQRMTARDPHVAVTPMQMMQVREASVNRNLLLRVNQGRPPIAATPRPGAFDAPNVVRARGATAPIMRSNEGMRTPAPGAHAYENPRANMQRAPQYNQPPQRQQPPAYGRANPRAAYPQRPAPARRQQLPQQRAAPKPKKHAPPDRTNR